MLSRFIRPALHTILRNAVSNDRVPYIHEELVSSAGDPSQLTAYMGLTATHDGICLPRNDSQDLLRTCR